MLQQEQWTWNYANGVLKVNKFKSLFMFWPGVASLERAFKFYLSLPSRQLTVTS